MANHKSDVEKLNASITALEAQRAMLGDAVVDPAIAALRQQISQTTAAIEKETPEDERKLVTIVFADISGFTALSEKRDPEEVREMMNACFQSLVPIVRKYGGTIDKFIGDEIMALFGAPVAHEDDPERALHAALEMMDAIAAFNRAHGTELDLHIGINTGPVIAGQIGTENHRDYSVIGEAGVGKSRFIAEARAAETQNVQWAEGRALSYTAGMSYWLSRAVLNDLLGIEGDVEPKTAAARLKSAIARELPKNFDDAYP